MGRDFELPAGYEMMERSGLSIAVKRGYGDTFEGLTISQLCSGSEGDPRRRGRGPLRPFPLVGDPAERALVRQCVRGGILGRFVRELHLNLGIPRPVRELEVSEYARARGIPTPEVLAAMCERVSPFFYRAALATREIKEGVDLESEFLAARYDGAMIDKKRRIISSLGRLIAKMHGAGIYHADLHLKNILSAGGALYVVDLDSARVRSTLSEFRRCMNLLRLYRSAQKLNRRGRRITRTDLLRFVRSYSEGSSRSTKVVASKLRRMLPLWRVKWKLSDTLGI